MIVREGKKFVVKSEKSGKRLSKPLSYGAAKKRLAQVDWFKSHPKK